MFKFKVLKALKRLLSGHQAAEDVLTSLQSEVAKMSVQLDALTAQVAANTTVIQSAVTLIHGLADQLVAIKDDPVAIQKLADDLKSQDDTLAKAVADNTPPVGP